MTGELAVAGHEPPADRRASGDARRGAVQLRLERRPQQRLANAHRRHRAGRRVSGPALSRRRAGRRARPSSSRRCRRPTSGRSAASVTYVTGAHALKFGFGDTWGRQDLLERDIDSATSYRFNNGVPTRSRMRASPVSRYDDLKAEMGLFVQDKWTMNRLTLNGGLRFDYFNTYFPETPLGPGPLVPTRNFTVRADRLVQLEGPVAARRGGLRPVRQRQDRAQGEHGPLRAGGRPTRSATSSRSWPTP